MNYARGGLAQMNEEQELLSNLQLITSLPGATEMLKNAMKETLGERTQQIRLFNRGGPVTYNHGGLAAAEKVRQMGRGDDEILLHVSPEEFDALRGMWGEPDINPNTGLPEYGWLSKIWKKAKHVVIPMIMNAVVPGSGQIYTMANAARQAGKAMKSGQAPAGSIPGIGAPTGLTMPGEFGDPFGQYGAGGMGPPVSPAPPNEPGWLSKAGSWIKDNPLLATGLGVGVFGALRGGGGRTTEGPPGLPSEFTTPLPQYEFTRQQQEMAQPSDYYTYGQVDAPQSGEFQFFGQNTLPTLAGDTPPAAALPGGNESSLDRMLRQLREPARGAFAGGGYARGAGSGRDDTIEAMLSDGEYVMDAETVSLLGDGSNEHGAKRLDEMRTELRKHKGQNLAKGKFSHNAKHPMQYLAKGGRAVPYKGYLHKPKEGESAATYEQRVAREVRNRINKGETRERAISATSTLYGVSESKLKELVLEPVKKARGGRIKNRMLARHMRKVAQGET